MHITVDQSPRIENWTQDSVIAFSNSKQRAILIPSPLKREALALLKKRGKTEDTAKWIILAAGIFLLLQDDLPRITSVVIDREFDDRTMKSLCHWLWQKMKPLKPTLALHHISFTSIKRKNPAHYLAYGVFKGLLKTHPKKITSRQLLPLFKK